jgi:hypothetical protein
MFWPLFTGLVVDNEAGLTLELLWTVLEKKSFVSAEK